MGIIMKCIGGIGARKALTEARALLENTTPTRLDCGRMCGAACCRDDESGENGMLLYPFEQDFYKKPIPGFDFHLVQDDSLYKGGYRLVCKGECSREHRPLACRLFPLRVKVSAVGEETQVKAELDPRAFICCPLAEQGGLCAVSGTFIEAVEAAGRCMVRSTDLLEALYREQDLIDEMRRL